MAKTLPSETPTNPELENNAQAEVDRLRKEAEQAQMRINQLENEKKARDKETEDAKQKQLEGEGQYKALYETEREKRERLESEQLEKTTNEAKAKAQASVLKEYSKEVAELAEVAGISLLEDSEDGRQLLKTKLDAIAAKVKSPHATGTPQYTPPVTAPEKSAVLEGMKVGAKEAQKDYLSRLSSIKTMKRQAGLIVE